MTKKTCTPEVKKLDVGQVEITPVMERIYEYENRENEIELLVESISNEGQKQPISVVVMNGKLVIIDGVLRYKAITRIHGLNEVDVLIQPDLIACENDLIDLIIHNQIHKEKTINEKLNEVKIILRLGLEDKNPKRDRETRIKLVERKLGKGWKKNNVLAFEKLLNWALENEDTYDLVTRVMKGEVSINKALLFLKTIEREDYGLKEESEALILKQYLNNNINELQVNNLICAYNNKKNETYTDFTLNTFSQDDYEIIVGDSSKTKLPQDTKIDLVITSIPYYQQIEYGNEEDGDMVKFEIGREKTPEEYVKNVCETFRLNFENINKSGVIVINVNESYKKAECVGVVPMIIMEMKSIGYKYIQTTCWLKKDEKPLRNNVKRLKTNFEYCLIFAKSTDYYFNPIKIYNENKKCRVARCCAEQMKNGKAYHMSNIYDSLQGFMSEQEMLDVIRINQNSQRVKRDFDTYFYGDYPSLLPAFFALIYSPYKGKIWEPYGGSGGTSIVLQLGRQLVLQELYNKNVNIIKKAIERNLQLKDQDALNRLNEQLWGSNNLEHEVESIDELNDHYFETAGQEILAVA